MLEEMPETPRRKLVLFAAGCCRQLEQTFHRPSAMTMLEAAEAFADGFLDGAALKKAIALAEADYATGNNQLKGRNHRDRGGLAAIGVIRAVTGRSPDIRGVGFGSGQRTVRNATKEMLNHLAHLANGRNPSLFSYDEASTRERDRVATILRDVVGPWSEMRSINPAWLTADVLSLAKSIYDARAFGGMPILADALQEAGCDDERILSHCRDPKQIHVRGCWVIDLG
jgi:hypothetical protein